MANVVKKTKRERFNEVIAFLNANNAPAEMVETIEHEIELLDRKNTSKNPDSPAAKKKAEKAKAERAEVMAVLNGSMTVGEIVKAMDYKFTAPKVTAILTKARKDGEVERTKVKDKPYYSKVEG